MAPAGSILTRLTQVLALTRRSEVVNLEGDSTKVDNIDNDAIQSDLSSLLQLGGENFDPIIDDAALLLNGPLQFDELLNPDEIFYAIDDTIAPVEYVLPVDDSAIFINETLISDENAEPQPPDPEFITVFPIIDGTADPSTPDDGAIIPPPSPTDAIVFPPSPNDSIMTPPSPVPSPSELATLTSEASPPTNETPLANSPKNEFLDATISSINVLQQWYNRYTDGLWDTTGWWNAANCLQVLGDFAVLRRDRGRQLGVSEIMENTFIKAQRMTVLVEKTLDAKFLPTSKTVWKGIVNQTQPQLVSRDVMTEGETFPGFLNDFYDDEGWWALALIRASDFTGKSKYLRQAISIFNDMTGAGAGMPCGGGIIWSKKGKPYVNAIANQLYFAVAASLANRSPNASFRNIAVRHWNWLRGSGMINVEGVFNDGLDSECRNNGAPTWTYNQGVVLGGLVELSRATRNTSLLDEAHRIAEAGIRTLTVNGVLKEIACEPGCGLDGPQFKGVFMRNLRYLHAASPRAKYRDYMIANARSILQNNSIENHHGLLWAGPFDEANAARQSSALDALIAATAVS